MAPPQLKTGAQVRLASRSNQHLKSTAGLAPSYLQANLIVLPSRYASDFRDLCARNPVPCPLLAESVSPGDYANLKSYIPGIQSGEAIASSLDIRTDAPRFNVYVDSVLAKAGVVDVVDEWEPDHVAFLIGCSYSFESALAAAGLTPRHIVLDRNVSMYRTSVPLNPAGVFTGATYVVSMRSYKASDVDKVRAITRRYLPTHGECIAWGWDAVAKLGIQDIDSPEWGDKPLTVDGKPLGLMKGDDADVPVFWGCGVTPQEAIVRAGLEGTVLGHAPGHMILLDTLENDILAQS
ncbi:Protein of unknown function (DUF1445) [Geosmithia morbida]|uniref:Uncharacterized protein n=1 Tax=Geosmithia morbida TaxID=1094350 RepID=A0A9P4YTV1_9HYPO|nr:Protein of unknown function (DUF1445) [Geosmithia morbida]KAF4122715.1 Protein of unknown function (DUF1445) [Geosmithia morbida]